MSPQEAVVECPSCGAKLRLKVRTTTRNHIACPKCKEQFAIPSNGKTGNLSHDLSAAKKLEKAKDAPKTKHSELDAMLDDDDYVEKQAVQPRLPQVILSRHKQDFEARTPDNPKVDRSERRARGRTRSVGMLKLIAGVLVLLVTLGFHFVIFSFSAIANGPRDTNANDPTAIFALSFAICVFSAVAGKWTRDMDCFAKSVYLVICTGLIFGVAYMVAWRGIEEGLDECFT